MKYMGKRRGGGESGRGGRKRMTFGRRGGKETRLIFIALIPGFERVGEGGEMGIR